MNVQTRLVKIVVFALALVQGLLTLPPLLLTYALYRFAQRAAVVIGHWPVPMVNDPKLIAQDDVPYQHLYDVVERMDGIAFCSFFAWFFVLAIAVRGYSRRTLLFQAGLFTVAWGMLWFHPGRMLMWWLD